MSKINLMLNWSYQEGGTIAIMQIKYLSCSLIAFTYISSNLKYERR